MIVEPLKNINLLYLAKENHKRTGCVWLAVLEPSELPKAAQNFLNAGFHLEDICGFDVAEGACAVYHFDLFESSGRVAVIALAPHNAPVFPSIAGIYQGAEWHERETRDFFGYNFEGNPNFVPLLLADDMAQVHPLKKDEESRAPFRKFFALEGTIEEVVQKAPGFTLLDALPEADPKDTGAQEAKEGDA
jgi:NADH-quinone oxidoreductase subunit C